MSGMAEKYMSFPGDLKALMMEEQAGLGKQGTLNLRTLTAGSTQYEDVVKALKVMDLDEEGLTSGKGKPSFMAGAASYEVDAEDAMNELEDKSLASEDVQDILAEIEGLNLVEDEAMDVLASLEKEKRSWKENKKLKLARRKDRRHFSGKPTGHYDRGGHSISTEQLKRVSRCSNCGDRGHWAEDCDKPYRSKKDRLAQEASAKKGKDRAEGRGGVRPTAFVFLGGPSTDNENEGTTFVAATFSGMAVPDYVNKVLEKYRKSSDGRVGLELSFLTLPPGHAIIDPGAGQDLIGLPAYQRLVAELRKTGLQPVKLQEKPGQASGVGGRATTLFISLVPFTLGGAPGIVKVTIVKEDIPHLLSIGLLESAGSIINTRTNAIHYETFGTKDTMRRMSSGHRTVSVAGWPGGEFPVPEEVQEKYHLAPGDFNLDGSGEEAYMSRALKVPREGRDHWKSVENSPLLLRVHELPRDQSYVPSSNDPEGCGGEDLEDVRVSLMMSSEGRIVTTWDDWRSDGIKKHEHEWRGISVFVRKGMSSDMCSFSKQHGNQRKAFHVSSASNSEDQKTNVQSTFPSFATSTGVDEPPSGGMEGGREGDREGQGQRREEGEEHGGEEGGLRAPALARGSGIEPIREVGAMPEVQDQDLLHASLASADDQEGEGLHGAVCQHHRGEATQEGGSRSEGREGRSRSRIVHRRAATDVGREQLAAVTRHDPLTQAITPVVQSQQAILEMSQQSLMNQTQMMQAVQSGQAEMTQALVQLANKAKEEDWDQVNQEDWRALSPSGKNQQRRRLRKMCFPSQKKMQRMRKRGEASGSWLRSEMCSTIEEPLVH